MPGERGFDIIRLRFLLRSDGRRGAPLRRRGEYESSDYIGLVRAGHQRRGDLRASSAAGAGKAGPRGPGGDPLQQPAHLQGRERLLHGLRQRQQDLSRRAAEDQPQPEPPP